MEIKCGILISMLTQKELIETNVINFFESINDPRVEGRCVFKLLDVIVISMCGILSGVESWVEMEEFGKTRLNWFKTFLDIEKIPSHDTFARVFSLINPNVFEKCFLDWCGHMSGMLSRVSLDGKSIKGTCKSKKKNGVHILNVYSHTDGLVIGQKVSTSSVGGEINAAVEALDFLNIKGVLISADAAMTCKRLIDKIDSLKGYYILPVKKNARFVYNLINNFFKNIAERKSVNKKVSYAETTENNRGRKEHRYCTQTTSTELLQSIKHTCVGVKSVFRIVRIRETDYKGFNKQVRQEDGSVVYRLTTDDERYSSSETTYYISNLNLTPQEALKEIRSHWKIENKLHRTLDITFHEDECRVRARTAAQNLSIMRKIAFNITTKHPGKGSKKTKIKKASWDTNFLEELIYYAGKK